MKQEQDNSGKSIGRRSVLGATALTGLAGVGAALGLNSRGAQAAVPEVGHLTTDVKPGELDQYYGFWSGGQSGEVRVLGMPSGHLLRRIPVFNFDAAYGWGITNYSRKLISNRRTGDTHHFHLSYTDGSYDGK